MARPVFKVACRCREVQIVPYGTVCVQHVCRDRKPRGTVSVAEILGEIAATYKSYQASWRAGDIDRAWPGAYAGVKGESPRVVAARGIEGLRTLGVLPTLAGSGSSASAGERTFLVVAHGRFNKILISALQGDVSKASDLQQGNTCINVLDFDADGRVLVRALNVREHLEPALAR